jgi:LysR family transcriptional regulator, regulator of gene expression of beta-lactamase
MQIGRTPMTPLCHPDLARQIATPSHLAWHRLLRSYRADEWPSWFACVATEVPPLRGPVFDTSVAIAHMVSAAYGVALLPPRPFDREIADGKLCRPFEVEVNTGAYWLTQISARAIRPAMIRFRNWLVEEAGETSVGQNDRCKMPDHSQVDLKEPTSKLAGHA